MNKLKQDLTNLSPALIIQLQPQLTLDILGISDTPSICNVLC